MTIDIEQYIQPIETAAKKLQTNDATAGKLRGDLDSAASELRDHGDQAKGDADKLRAQWDGGKGTTFEGKAGKAPTSLEHAAADAAQISKKVGDAMGKVAEARKDVEQLKTEFISKANTIKQAAEAAKTEGKAAALLKKMGAQYAHAAAQIVNAAKGSLSGAAGASTTASSAGPTSAGPIGSRSSGSAAATGTSSAGGGATGGGGGGGGGATSTGSAETVPPPKNDYNNGTKTVKLPGGKEVEAPNKRAAAAVRAAMSRKGLPYKWGGTNPKTGMDCSGLTQWAYGQAGVKLPRTSGGQTVGKKVDVKDIQPGDLVVWDGHVAMYVGDGKIIEEPHTGAVCHITDMRTSNAGDALKGVFRPSA